MGMFSLLAKVVGVMHDDADTDAENFAKAMWIPP
jgi:hypothetical protein